MAEVSLNADPTRALTLGNTSDTDLDHLTASLDSNLSYSERTDLFNGLAQSLSPDQLGRLRGAMTRPEDTRQLDDSVARFASSDTRAGYDAMATFQRQQQYQADLDHCVLPSAQPSLTAYQGAWGDIQGTFKALSSGQIGPGQAATTLVGSARFNYGILDDKWGVTNRLNAGVGLAGSTAEFVVGEGLTDTGPGALAGVPLMVHAVDNGYAQFQTLKTGQYTPAQTTKALAAAGMSPAGAELTNSAIGLVGTTAGSARIVSMLKSGEYTIRSPVTLSYNPRTQLNTGVPVNLRSWLGKVTEGVSTTTETGMQWGKGIQLQGQPFETWVQKTLPLGTEQTPPNFEAIDHINRGTGLVTSTKTIDVTTSAKLSNPQQIFSTLKGYVDKLSSFPKGGSSSLEGFTVRASEVKTKEIQIGIPVQVTQPQLAQVFRAAQYARSLGIDFKVTFIRP